jgi:hypothetical protein
MILLNPFELQKTEFENKAKQLSEELAKTEEYILMYSSLKKKLTSQYKFYKSLSEPVVKLLIENKSSFKGGKDDKKALEIARKKVDDYIQSNLSKFFSEK